MPGWQETASRARPNYTILKGCALPRTSGVFLLASDLPPERGRADICHTVPQTASNTSQCSGSAWGSQPPEGGILLPFASHCWTQSGAHHPPDGVCVRCCRVTRQAKSMPTPRHSYRERDCPLRQAMFKLQRVLRPGADRSAFPSCRDAACPADLETAAP